MTTQRHSYYRPIHKAMRHVLFDTSHKVGLTDFDDDADVREVLEAVDRMIMFLHEHRENEDKYIHPRAESRIPGITAKLVEEHDEDIRLSDEIQGIAGQIRTAEEAERGALGIKLHERLNDYIGIYLGHLYREETTIQQALWDNFTDHELRSIDAELVSNLPGQVMAQFLPVMCSTYSVAEITPILTSIKANAPAEYAQFALQTAEQNMPPHSWEKVRARLG